MCAQGDRKTISAVARRGQSFTRRCRVLERSAAEIQTDNNAQYRQPQKPNQIHTFPNKIDHPTGGRKLNTQETRRQSFTRRCRVLERSTAEIQTDDRTQNRQAVHATRSHTFSSTNLQNCNGASERQHTVPGGAGCLNGAPPKLTAMMGVCAREREAMQAKD